MECINFDTFYNIIKFLDVLSIRNFILSSKNLKEYHNKHIDYIISNKILDLFQLKSNSFSLDLEFNLELNKIYNNCSSTDSIEDIIIFLFNNGVVQEYNDKLIIYLINVCYEHTIFINYTYNYNNKYAFSFESIEYLLVYSNESIFEHILKTYNEKIQMIILKKVLSHILYITNEFNFKVKLLVDYILKSTAFDLYFDTHFLSLLIELIQYNKHELLVYIFKHKKHIFNNYHKLINCAIQCDNIQILELLYTNFMNESSEIIIIQPITIELMCELGKFETFPFILLTFIGQSINNGQYILAILNGLKTFFIQKEYNNFNISFNLSILMKYLSIENKKTIYDELNKHFNEINCL